MAGLTRKMKDLRGQQFGLLSIPGDAEPKSRISSPDNPKLGAAAYWPCVCECGRTIQARGSSLRQGTTISCGATGCQAAALKRADKPLTGRVKLCYPPIGKVFGRLTVLGLGEMKTNGNRARWKFQCSCGVVKEQVATKVFTGEIRSCGCLMREAVSAANTKYTDRLLKYKHSIIGKYKSHSKRKNRAFELTNEEFFSLMAQPCAYCGTVQGSTRRGRYGDVLYNGIDRVDVSQGYIKDNCVPCCKICNVMKQSLSVDEFIDHIERIRSHMKRGK